MRQRKYCRADCITDFAQYFYIINKVKSLNVCVIFSLFDKFCTVNEIAKVTGHE